ncbi:inositol monophosphatase family protein [Aliiroseovarius sp. YM-037]|uniref:inositol monophosphatase family protein n=1 Tax=Aliiroseovarius sp. YM-037 TaxID=3341728 RepID=UPI003A804114
MPARDIDLLIDVARAAGRIAERHWKSALDIWDKPGGAGPVTAADLEVNRMMAAELRTARPDYGWLSEETEDTPERLDADRVFIIDPIDGTRAFINGEKNFSHSLAVAENGVVVAAVVYVPMLDALYSATAGEAAQQNGEVIKVCPTNPDTAQILSTKANFIPENWPGGVPEVKRHFRSSLAYRLCLVADGQFDGMLTLRDTWEWDVAAGSLIVAQAGGFVTDRQGAGPRFNSPRPMLRGIVAAEPDLHADLTRRLRPVA